MLLLAFVGQLAGTLVALLKSNAFRLFEREEFGRLKIERTLAAQVLI
jgi:curli biogenesis system outer membrane secretion channel CsgG